MRNMTKPAFLNARCGARSGSLSVCPLVQGTTLSRHVPGKDRTAQVFSPRAFEVLHFPKAFPNVGLDGPYPGVKA